MLLMLIFLFNAVDFLLVFYCLFCIYQYFICNNYQNLFLTLIIVSDLCKEKECTFNGKCVTKNDRITECRCLMCPRDEQYAPVCGDNGKTYATSCQLKYESCILKERIFIVKSQPCSKY